MPGTNAVELHQAFVWTCDDCGRDNFARAITLSPEEVAVMLGDDNLTRDETDHIVNDYGLWLKAPETVICDHCGIMFGAETP